MIQLNGHCQCGRVRYSAPKADSIKACHCNVCRRITSGPHFGMSCHDGITITSDKTLAWYESSDWARRGFCNVCGTSLFYNLKGTDFYSVSVGTLDQVPDLEVTKEYFIDEKPDFYGLEGDRVCLTGAEAFANFEADNNDD